MNDNDNKKVITLVGRLACGKGAVAEYMKKKHKTGSYRYSTILRDILNRLHLEISRHRQQKLSTLLRECFDENILAKVIAEDVNKDNSRIIVIDGVRRFADIKYLKMLKGFKLVSIEADAKIRHQRLVWRMENRGDSKKSFEEFLADQKNEADAQIPKVMATADLTIKNNGSLKNLHKQCDNIINNIS